MNHLRPLITHSSPSSTARVWSWVGSEPATSGSVMAKLGEISPRTSGSSYRSRCSASAYWWSMIESCSVKVPSAIWPYSLRPCTSFT